MIETVYVEAEAADHPRTREILRRLTKARVIPIQRYGEVFNRKRQDFRLQKQQPALILAVKHGRKLLPTPPGYGIGRNRNFYFSHLLNCLYDCRYCFLQGMLRSAHYVFFVNWDDLAGDISEACDGDESACFFSGYDCDSLALDRLTGFAADALELIADRPRALLELRTKSVQVEALKRCDPIDNCVVAMSFTPQEVSVRLESGVPSVERRLRTLSELATLGWRVGLRFDPLIWTPDWLQRYQDLFNDAFSALPPDAIHSVSFGGFRMPVAFRRTLARLYPDDAFLAAEALAAPVPGEGESTAAREREMFDWCRRELTSRLPAERIFECTTTATSSAQPDSRPAAGVSA